MRWSLVIVGMAAWMLGGTAAWGEGRRTDNPMSAEQLRDRVVAAGRPRLFFQGDGLAELRKAINTSHAEKWQNLKAAVEASLDEGPPDYRPPRVGGDPTRPGTPNDEMLWQRQFGYTVPGMALVALLDEDPKYFEHVRAWALKPSEYPVWGAGIFENTGLAAKHQLFGLAIAYDWLYERWSEEDRATLRETLREHGRILYEAAEGINDRGWWKDTWRQNHAWNGYQALGVTAIALMGEEPDAGVWLEKALWGARHIVAELPDEGAYEEGIPYWGYGMEALVRLITAVQPYADDFYEAPYLRHTHLFRLYLAGPELWQVANFGDGLTRDWHAMATTMYRLAAEYRDPLTQWLGDELPQRDSIDATCWTLLWWDPSLTGALPDDQPRSHAFRETGFAGARTSWDEDAMTVHLRSGQAHVSHSHLDINNFLLNAGGEWLLQDYGYGKVGPGYFNKETIYFNLSTAAHNCLVIGGRDQRADEDSVGVITHAQEQDGLVWWRSDATKCYEGARSVVRELALVQPEAVTGKWGFVVVRDRVETQRPETFDFMLQPGGEVELDGDSFVIRGERASLYGKVISPLGVTMSVTDGIGELINVKDPKCLYISAPESDTEMEFMVALVARAEGEAAPLIRRLEGDLVGVEVDGTKLVFSTGGAEPPQITSN